MILVDSNVLIDVIKGDVKWSPWSEAALEEAADRDEVAINPIIYAEISIGFALVADLDALIAETGLRRLPLPYAAGFVAGKAFMEYRRRGGTRTSPLPDFYIGAHAALSGMQLLTRDRARFATYFPALSLIAP
ncbi:MAG: type II toxin-antitoxin system VapC family toxin [Hyphomonadaceae bacterium]|nr:type II toxin-antitoxin system VapC family toxin [Hyphomonadaceae bacterium]